jgi:hypothetical protein
MPGHQTVDREVQELFVWLYHNNSQKSERLLEFHCVRGQS